MSSSSKDSKMKRFPQSTPPSHQKPPGECNITWRRIPKGSEHTAPGDPAAKLCRKARSSLVEIQSTNKNRVFEYSAQAQKVLQQQLLKNNLELTLK